jgi:putative methanogenesis marker protein 15
MKLIKLALISCGVEYSGVLEELERLANELGAKFVIPNVDSNDIKTYSEGIEIELASNDLKLMMARGKSVVSNSSSVDGVFIASCFRCAEGAIARNAITNYIHKNSKLPTVSCSFTERTKVETLLLRLEALVNVVQKKSLLARKIQTGLTIGIDSGSTMTKVSIMKDNAVLDVSWGRTEGNVIASAEKALKIILESTRMKMNDFDAIGTTGYGRNIIGKHFNAKFMQEEITVCAKGASFLAGKQEGPATVIDIGGMDNKATALYNGIPVGFTVGSICAGSSGKFLESCAQRLGVDIEEFGELAQKGDHRKIKMNAYCIVFGMQDLVAAVGRGAKPEDVASAACYSVAQQFYEQNLQEIPVVEPVIQVGGTSGIKGLVDAVENSIGYRVIVPPYSKFTGAIGAAILVSGMI